MLRNKIIRFKKIYKFYFNHFSIKCTVLVLNGKNVIKNEKLNFLDKFCDMQIFKSFLKYFDIFSTFLKSREMPLNF